MYLLAKIHKRLHSVPGRLVFSNCGAPTEKFILDKEIRPQEDLSYIKDSNDFVLRIKDLKDTPKDALFVTADVVGLHPSIPHEAGLRGLREVLDRRNNRKISTNDLVTMTEFVLRNNCLEFNSKVKHQISGAAIGTKFVRTYAYIFMDEIETKLLESQESKPLVWSFIWTHEKEKLERFLNNVNLLMSLKKKAFLSWILGFPHQEDLHVKPANRYKYLHFTFAHTDYTKRNILANQALSISRIY